MPSCLLIDLFNTLLPGGDQGRWQMFHAMAGDLGVDPEAFAKLMRQTWPERMRGAYRDAAGETEAVATLVGPPPGPAGVDAAVARRLAFARAHLVPPASSIDTLTSLRAAGWKIAIVSNCTFDSATAVRNTALNDAVDAIVLSCEVYVGKPDPRIYLAACEALGQNDPAKCVYVGDGADDELAGASALGMRVIQTIEFADAHQTWTGEQITALAQLPALLAS
jgi:putative hydrolase of the HAD superfamily